MTMNTIIDYLDWRGDLSFNQDPLNEVDNLIFSVLSYSDFSGVVPGLDKPGSVTLQEAADRIGPAPHEVTTNLTRSFFAALPLLLEKCAQTERFANLQLSHYIDRIEFAKAEQFSAVVFSLDERLHFIAFSGTDDTLAGWKEDLEMSFREAVPAQRDATRYAQAVMANLSGDFYLGGHSKGGNLAVYAAAHLTPEEQQRIIAVYNNDGPGFLANIIEKEGYQRVIHKVTTFIPQSSVAGILLEHEEKFQIIRSNETGLMQHNAFSWEVLGKHFVYEQELSKSSLVLSQAIRAWLNNISLEERSQFVEALFKVIDATGAKTLSELSEDKLATARAMITTFTQMEEETQTILKKVVESFFAESQKILRSSLGEGVESFMQKTLKRIKPSEPNSSES
jgi:hypothetical protein